MPIIRWWWWQQRITVRRQERAYVTYGRDAWATRSIRPGRDPAAPPQVVDPLWPNPVIPTRPRAGWSREDRGHTVAEPGRPDQEHLVIWERPYRSWPGNPNQ